MELLFLLTQRLSTVGNSAWYLFVGSSYGNHYAEPGSGKNTDYLHKACLF